MLILQCFFRHLNLETASAIPALNDKKKNQAKRIKKFSTLVI